MKKKYLILFVLFLLANSAFAQKDTLVYYLTANGDLAPSRQAAYCKLVVFPVGSGSGAKLSAIKAIGNDGKPIFSGSSNTHGFPIHAVGAFTQYYPDGTKMSVKTFSNGFPVGDETDFYLNGNIKSSLQPNGAGDADKMEYYEDGTLKMEHHPAPDHRFKETYYYPGRKIERTVVEGNYGPELTEYYVSGKIKSVENQTDKGKKTIKTAYFPNGNIYYKFERNSNKNNFGVRYVECRDSTGKPLAQNGNGNWVEYDENFTFITKQGKIVNGYADSIWTILFWSTSGLYETYQKGKLVGSEGFKAKDSAPAATGERMPEFPGGSTGLNKFLTNHIKYPATARETGTTGTVVLHFMVGLNGTLSDFRIVTGIGAGCDEEVIRVMKTCPPWTPGTVNGIPANVDYAIPVHFSLSEDGNSGWITVETD